MKRRLFLLGAAGVTALFGWRFLHTQDEEAVVAVIYKRLGYLKLDDPGVRQFARDFAARRLVSSAKLRTVAAMGPLFRDVSLPQDVPLAGDVGFAEERITTLYLLSTDFFTGGSDAGRTVQYQQYYDAMRGCSNPFRRSVAMRSTV